MSVLSKYDFHINEIKEQVEKTKELNRKVINQQDVLGHAIQDRILGEIDTEELGKIIKESENLTGKCWSARMEIYRWSLILSGIKDELEHISNNTGYSLAEMDSEINVAKLFSDVEKFKKCQEKDPEDDTAEWIDKEVRGTMTNVCSKCGVDSIYPTKHWGNVVEGWQMDIEEENR